MTEGTTGGPLSSPRGLQRGPPGGRAPSAPGDTGGGRRPLVSWWEGQSGRHLQGSTGYLPPLPPGLTKGQVGPPC